MSAQTAASRYTCRDCGKTYRSFRPEDEWRATHIVEVCAAQDDLPVAAAPAPQPQPEVQVTDVPGEANARWWQTDLVAVAGALLVTLLLFGVALDAVNMLSDAANAGPRAATLLLSAVIAGPCVYAVYQLVRMAAAVDAPEGS